MPTKYVHTNIVAKNWKKLAKFYEEVLDCKPILPERDLTGEWIDKATALENVRIKGIHLALPGNEQNGPTLEIFNYNNMSQPKATFSNSPGFSHIAFQVDKVEETAQKVFDNGGSPLGELTKKEIDNVGIVTFWYVHDPEGNIVELQSWEYKNE